MATDRPVRFSVTLQPEGSGTYVVIPDDVVTALGARGRTSVTGTIDGRPFRNQVMPYRDESPAGRRFYMVVNRAVRTTIGKGPGDHVVFELARDAAPRPVDVPAELLDALAADPAAREAFDALAPSHRREYAEFVAEARRDETRRRRALATVDRIRASADGGQARART